jgi:hypothetical protein
MTTTVFKFPLAIQRTQAVEMPAGAQALTVQVQHMDLCLWALVDPAAPKVPRMIEILGTGHSANPALNRRYIGSAQQLDGAFVWHVFEVLP